MPENVKKGEIFRTHHFHKEHIQHDSRKGVKTNIMKKFTVKQKCRIYLEKKGEVGTVTTFRNM